jgi:hypothetical protein
LKSFRIHGPFHTDDEVLSDDFIEKCAQVLGAMTEFIATLNDIVEPDGDSDSSDNSNEGEEEEEEEE